MQMKQLGKTTLVSLMATFLGLTLLMVTIPFAAAGSGYTMYAPPLTIAVTVDGMWSGGEWTDAPQYTMVNSTGGNIGYIRAKFDSTHLYVMIDTPWDTTNSTVYYHENVWLAFDTLNNGGSDPQSDDYLIGATTSWGARIGWVGNGSYWDPTQLLGVTANQAGEDFGTRGNVSLTVSFNDRTTRHKITEVAVPLSYVGSAGSTVGFFALVEDDSTDPDGYGPSPATAYSEWPSGAGGTPGYPGPPSYIDPCPAPSVWGNLKLAPVIYAPPLTVPVDLNGSWSTGEWADAPQYTMVNSTGGNIGYIRAKFDSTHLYVMIDSPWDTTNSTVYYHENVWLAFDTLNNGGSDPQSDDYLIGATTSWGARIGWVGNGSYWDPTQLLGVTAVQAGEDFGTRENVSLTTSPNDPVTPHRITEMAVPLSYVGSAGSTVGFFALVEDDSTDPDGYGPLRATAYSEWPSGAGGTPGYPGQPYIDPCPAPSVWGLLRLGERFWDVNDDTKVNIVDIVIVALSFGSEPGDEKWNPSLTPLADVAPAFRKINIVDIVKVALHFGEQY